MACSRPNHVPVKAPHRMVAMDSTHKSCTAVEAFLFFTVMASAASRNRHPYPASPMIMAKNRVKKPRNQKEISYSR